MKNISFPADTLEAVFDAIQKLTRIQRILICAGLFGLIGGAFFYFSYMPAQQEIEKLSAKNKKLERRLRTARVTAMSKPRFIAREREAREKFELAKAALPLKQEIPSLLSDISQSGQDAGLEFLLFKPGSEISNDFFAEIPVQITVTGGFHQVALFFDRVSGLSRIVNIRDIDMTATKDPSRLRTSCTAVTYRFVVPATGENAGGKNDKKKKIS